MSGPAKKAKLQRGERLELDPADIFIPERIGFHHPDKAAAIGRLMAVDGQHTPILVTRLFPKKSIETCKAEGHQPWQLVAGLHRTKGAEIEGILVIADEVMGKPEDLATLEASENIHRRPLGPIEKAKFVAALVTAAQERIARAHGDLDQYQRGAKARWDRFRHGEEGAEGALRDETEDACSKLQQAYSWEQSACEAFDMERTAIYRSLAISRMIVEPFPDLVEALAKHPVVGNNASQLKALTQLKDEGVRRCVIEALLANTEIGVEDAKIAAGVDAFAAKVEPVAHMKFVFAVESNWKRLTITQQREQLPRIAAMLTVDMKKQLRDQLIAEIGLPRDPSEFEEGTLAWQMAKEGKL